MHTHMHVAESKSLPHKKGICLHTEQYALPKSLKVKRSDLRRNKGESLKVNNPVLASRVCVCECVCVCVCACD